MIRIACVLVIMLFFAIPVSAIEKGQFVVPNFPLPTQVPLQLHKVEKVKHGYEAGDGGIVGVITKIFIPKKKGEVVKLGTIDYLESVTPPEVMKSKQVHVYINDAPVAIIPETSKFNGVVIHDFCLRWGYGTDKWYNCEVGYASV